MTELYTLLQQGVAKKASDFHFTVGTPPVVRVFGKLIPLNSEILTAQDCEALVHQILDEKQWQYVVETGEIDIAYAVQNISRFRVNIFRQRGSYALALRVINAEIPTIDSLDLPPVLKELTKKQSGLVLVTGPTGSGKSTTLAAMINYMNTHQNRHIITIEDPIEYLHRHHSCIINQRELGNDTLSFANALRAALREDPDVILVGEMRDLETITTAMVAAETGHIVLSTLHTIGAAKTVDRIIDSFPENQQVQASVQLASVLNAVISQQILPRADGQGRAVGFEIMIANPAVKNLIREGKSHQLQSVIEVGNKEQMRTMDNDLISLYRTQAIDKASLLQYAVDPIAVMRNISVNNN